MPRRAQLAKLTRPRLHKAVVRERLFALLDEAREHKPAICVVGPPGAGKTTLVASWLDARGIKGIWYQVDPGDADLATFFYYLGEAARPFARKGQRPLQLLTPEYLQDVEGFCRRFFRELFARLPKGAALVLDNYQEIAPEEKFHQLIARSVHEVPPGMTLIAISRRDPPEAYARLMANEHVQLVDWNALKLTLDEARAIADARGALSDDNLKQLHEHSGGWAAGLTLLLENPDRPATPFGGMERVFDYFAVQIFNDASARTRRFLVETALLPNIPVSLARALTENPDAGTILEDLYRRHLFTHRKPAQEPTYWYHALFRSFLQARGRALLEESERQAFACRAARLLDSRGEYQDAFLLFGEAGDWEAAARLVLQRASQLLALGRWQTLREWISALPPESMEKEPWLGYWLGNALMPVSQQSARAQFEVAFARFAARGDTLGQALAASAIIDTIYFEWSDFHPFTPWIEALAGLIDTVPFGGRLDYELRVYSSLLIATLFVAPGHRMLARCVARVMEMLDEHLDPNSKVMAASHLLTYCGTARDLDRAQQIESRIGPLLEDSSVTPLNRIWWNLRIGQSHAFQGQYESADRYLQIAADIAQSHGLSGLRTAALLIRSFRLMVAGAKCNNKLAGSVALEIYALAESGRPTDVWMTLQTQNRLACLREDYARMHEIGPRLVRAAERTGMVNIELLSLLDWSHALAALGFEDDLRCCLMRIRQLIEGTCLAVFEVEVPFVEAYGRLRAGAAEEGRQLLGEALGRARLCDFAYANMLRVSLVLAELLDEACAQRIERDYAKRVIRQYGILPPASARESWPWQIRIFTLGKFAVMREDQPVEFKGKAPKKVLSLLKAIVAFGGVDVPTHELVEALWPDEDGDAGYDALTVTLSRVRKLLGAQEALLVSAEKVSLNPHLVRIDIHTFERLIKEADTDSMPAADVATRLLDLYRGNFLSDETEMAWALRPRLRLRTQFLRLLERVGQRLEEAQDWPRAMDCYVRGLEADDLAEGFYQGMMRCHAAQGRLAEGIAVFRRLRQTLSVVLGVAPSIASEALARQLHDQAPAR